MDQRIDAAERKRRGIGALVVAVLFALPLVAYAREALVPGAPGDATVRVLSPAPWAAFRAGGTLVVAAAVEAPMCTVTWPGGGSEKVVARDGVCRATHTAPAPGVWSLRVSTAGPAGESRLPVAVYDPHAGEARGVGADGAFRVSFAAAYQPWRRAPAAHGEGDLAGPGGLTGEVHAVDWVVVTPGTTAVKGTAVTGDGTPYGFVAYGTGERERLRLVVWRADRPGSPDLE